MTTRPPSSPNATASTSAPSARTVGRTSSTAAAQPGFLHVLDPVDGHSVLGWADLRGNRQYLSVGNLATSPRVSLLLMDYAHQRRLKIIGTAHVTDVTGGTSRTCWKS